METRYSLLLGFFVVCVSHTSCNAPDPVCPNVGSVVVSQDPLAPRPDGQVRLVCDYRVASGQLLYFSWSIHEINTAIYSYNPENNPPGTIDRPDIVLNTLDDITGANDITGETGHSEILINAAVSDVQTYKCDVYLQDHSYCLDSKPLEFVCPDNLEIKSDGTSICNSSSQPCYPDTSIIDGSHEISGHVDFYCQPGTELHLSVNGQNSSSTIQPDAQGLCQESVSATITDFTSQDIVIFTVVETGQTCSLQYPDPEFIASQSGGCGSTCKAGVGVGLALLLVIIIALILAMYILRRQKTEQYKKQQTNGSSTNTGYSTTGVQDPEYPGGSNKV